MAVQEKVNFSLEDVLNQDIFGEKIIEGPSDCFAGVKLALVNLAEERGCQNIDWHPSSTWQPPKY